MADDVQEGAELSISNLGVQEVHTGGVNPDQDITVVQLRLWSVDQKQGAFLFVLINDECFHWLSPISS
jgi:hypothetical protein